MATPNQIKQMEYAQMQAAKARAQAASPPPAVGGYPVASAQEAADVAAITEPQGGAGYDIAGKIGPAVLDTAMAMGEPKNLIPTVAGAYATAKGGPAAGRAVTLAAQPVGTAVQNWAMSRPLTTGLGTDMATNVGGQVIGEGLSYGARAIGGLPPVQAVRSWVAKKFAGKLAPDAIADYAAAEDLVGDLADAVNKMRAAQGKSAYTSEEFERKLSPHIANLQTRGVFTVPQLTHGGYSESLEGVSSGAIGARGIFASKKKDQDVFLDEWPKVWSRMLGEEGGGPDALATTAAWAINGTLHRREKAAGALMETVQSRVGKDVIDIAPEDIGALAKQLELYAKRTKDAGGARKIGIDPEGIDSHVNAAIGIVERGTGLKFDPDTLTFVQREGGISKEIMDYATKATSSPEARQKMIDQLTAASGATSAPSTKIDFTFDNIQTLQGHLGYMAKKAGGADKAQAEATLATLRGILNNKLEASVAARDVADGIDPKVPDSLTQKWRTGRTEYGNVQKLRESFDAQGWADAMANGGVGKDVLAQVWPDGADIARVGYLRDLMGGETSPVWKQVRRYKMEDLLSRHDGRGGQLLEFLTDPKKHGEDYWRLTLGDNFDPLLKYARVAERLGKKNPFTPEAGLARRMDSGLLMTIATPSVVRAATGNPVTTLANAATTAGAATAWVVANRQIAKWLTNPSDSKMFLHILTGKPVRMKERAWLRSWVGRAAAEVGMNEEPDIRPMPLTVPKQGFAAATGRR